MREEVEGRTEEDRLPAGDVAVDDARLEILLCPEPPGKGEGGIELLELHGVITMAILGQQKPSA
jgi:hypothetical protein